jgi:pimeloyl-ACP methyl ester carboxylesterase
VGMVVAATVAMVVAGCTSTTTAGSPSAFRSETTVSAAATDGASYVSAPCPDPNLPGWPQGNLGPNYTCGYLTVPEDRSKPDGRTIRLTVARVKAASATPQPDPIVYLEGGPGVSGLLSAPGTVLRGINADRDVIFVGQRGTYHDDPFLPCPEIDLFVAKSFGEHLSDPATGEQSNAATQACRDRLASTGVDLASYDTAENASDIADLRVAMGIKEWNVYGVSYGTDLALTLLRDHPEGIRSVVLDSVVPPNLDNLMDEFWPGAAIGYKAVFDACAAQAACAAAYPNLADEFAATVNRLAKEPVTVAAQDASGATVQLNIDGYQFANLIIMQSGAPGSFAGIPRMIDHMAKGDAGPAAQSMVNYVPAPGLTSFGLQWGAMCREYASHTSPAQALAKAKAALPEFPDEVLRLLPQLPRYFDDCAIWNVGHAPQEVHAPVVSDVPVLLMGGTFDGITPVEWQDEVTPGLKNSQVVPIPGVGHVVIRETPCAQSVMTAFIDNPNVPVDRTCVTQMALPTFTTS